MTSLLKEEVRPSVFPYLEPFLRLCKMQVLTKGLAMRSHEFILRLTIAEFGILNTKRHRRVEDQHGACTAAMIY